MGEESKLPMYDARMMVMRDANEIAAEDPDFPERLVGKGFRGWPFIPNPERGISFTVKPELAASATPEELEVIRKIGVRSVKKALTKNPRVLKGLMFKELGWEN